MAYGVVTSHTTFFRKSNIHVRPQFDMVDGSSIEYLGFALYDGARWMPKCRSFRRMVYNYLLLLFIAANVNDEMKRKLS